MPGTFVTLNCRPQGTQRFVFSAKDADRKYNPEAVVSMLLRQHQQGNVYWQHDGSIAIHVQEGSLRIPAADVSALSDLTGTTLVF